MSRFNSYLNNHFSSCRLIARARDTCRERDVKLYAIPGFWDVVGVTDGTDAWIAPSSTGPFFKTATGDVTAIMRRLEAGEEVGPVPEAPQTRRRARLEGEPDTPPPRRSRTPLEASVDSGSRRRTCLQS